MKEQSIEKLVKENLCFQCGTCSSICPTNAITMEKIESRGLIYPRVNDKCVNCGKCLKICPINNIDLDENHLPSDNDYIALYKSTDKKRLNYTASGGLVTELVKYLFVTGKINKAIMVGMDEDKPTDAKTYIVEGIEDLEKVSGSFYQPVALTEVLKTINKSDRVAIIGLPCHIRGLELFLSLNKHLGKCIVIKIGLICTIGRGKHGTRITLKKSFGVKEEKEIKKIIYRFGMPPGIMKVNTIDGVVKEKSCLEMYKNTDYIFIPKGCLFCTDLFNDKADITVGDPWGMDKGKISMAIIRNDKTKHLIESMVNENYLVFDSIITSEQCINTQKHCVNYKIHNYAYRMSVYKKMGVKIPNMNLDFQETTMFKEKIGYGGLMVNSLIFNSKLGFILNSIIPNKILYKYRDVISSINTKNRDVEGEV